MYRRVERVNIEGEDLASKRRRVSLLQWLVIKTGIHKFGNFKFKKMLDVRIAQVKIQFSQCSRSGSKWKRIQRWNLPFI